MFKKKLSLTVVKDGKKDCRDHHSGVLQWERDQPNSGYSRASGNLQPGSRQRARGRKITKRNHQEQVGFQLNPPTRIPAEGSPG